MAEMEIDYNQTVWEYSRLTESGQKLVPMFGPGYTGKIDGITHKKNFTFYIKLAILEFNFNFFISKCFLLFLIVLS